MKETRIHAPGDVRRYVPKARGNREDPDPVVVWIKQPTERDYRAIACHAKDVAVDGGNGDDPSKMRMYFSGDDIQAKQDYTVERFVDKVENYSADYRDKDTGELLLSVEIVDGETLVQHGNQAIVSEVASEIMWGSKPTEDFAKKFVALSPGTQAKTIPPGGNAKNAKSMGSTSKETATVQTPTLST